MDGSKGADQAPVWRTAEGKIDYREAFRRFHKNRYIWDKTAERFFQENLDQIVEDARKELESITENGMVLSSGDSEHSAFNLLYHPASSYTVSTNDGAGRGNDEVMPKPAAVFLLFNVFAFEKNPALTIYDLESGKWLQKKKNNAIQYFIKQTISIIYSISAELWDRSATSPISSESAKNIYRHAQRILKNCTNQKTTWATKVYSHALPPAIYFKAVRAEAEKLIQLASTKPTLKERINTNLQAMVRVANRYASANAKLFKEAGFGANQQDKNVETQAVQQLTNELSSALLKPPVNIEMFATDIKSHTDFSEKLSVIELKYKGRFSHFSCAQVFTTSGSTPIRIVRNKEGAKLQDLYQYMLNSKDLYYCTSNDLERSPEQCQQDGMQNSIAAREMYIEILKAYQHYIMYHSGLVLPNAIESRKQLLQELQQEINTCKKQLCSLKAACAESHIGWDRAIGGVLGAIPGVVIATGGLAAMYGEAEAANAAIEALNEVFTEGAFTKLGEGLAGGNPILWSLVAGICLGAVGVIVGITSAAEVASHIRGEDKAAEYILGELKQLGFKQPEQGKF